MMTAYGTVETAVEAMQKGAYHYIGKPINLDELKLNVKKALNNQGILIENRYLKEELSQQYGDLKIIGESKPIQEVLSTVARVAPTNSTVLIIGESGTGKELVARAVHTLSQRKDERFIPVSCAALPETLLESELFGYEKGAFTGAVKKKEGRFELADGGTLFLDEIGDIPLETQVKLLRVIESQEFDRLGGKDTLKVDVRIIAATNQNLEKRIREKTFREDLYYRLNVISILIPPLRERKEDVIPLVEHFIKKSNQKCGKEIRGITQRAKEILLSYDWPGNVRELENAIEHGFVRALTEIIQPANLPRDIREQQPLYYQEDRQDYEKKIQLLQVLERHNWHLGHAADELGINRSTLWRRMKKYKIKK